MNCYSAQPRDQIFAESREFFPFPKNVGKNKNYRTIQSSTDALKTVSTKAVQNGHLFGNEIPDKIKKSQKRHRRILQKQAINDLIEKSLKIPIS